MKNRRKWTDKIAYTVCVTLLMQMCSMAIPQMAFATETAGQEASQTESQERGLGYVILENETLEEDKYPSVSAFSVTAETASPEAELPSAYRSDQVMTEGETISYLPNGFRNQNPYGTCWAFSALGACEASMIRKGYADHTFDLSERHLAYYFYNKGETADPTGGAIGDYDVAICDPNNVKDNFLEKGGNSQLTMWHLASWCGPVAESVAPYGGIESAAIEEQGLLGKANSTKMAYETDACHVQNIYMIPLGNMTDKRAQKDVVKKLIMEYGALGMSYWTIDSETYDSKTFDSYYQNINTGQNHAVQVVGWDDTFPKENFASVKPDEDGAWLIKNSWGSEDGTLAQNGYFWLSYCDASVNQASDGADMPYAYVFDAEPADNYDNIYQYDGDAGNSRMTLPTTLQVANCFKVQKKDNGGEYLKSVGVGVAQSNVSGQIEIYKNLTNPAKDPMSGEKVLTQSFSLDYAGYHTIQLDGEILLENESVYSVVFRFDGDSIDVFLSKDQVHTNFVRVVTKENADVSFYGTKGNWNDVADTNGAVFRIKAYTDNVSANGIPGGEEDNPGGGNTEQPGGTESGGTEEPGSGGNEEPGGSEDDGAQDDDGTGENPPQVGGEDVQPEIVPVILTALTLKKTQISLVAGKMFQLEAVPTYSAQPEEGSEWMVYWKSSNPEVATVTSYGMVTAASPGETTITVYNGDVSASCKVTVAPAKTKIKSITPSKAGKAALKWKKTDGADGYEIYRATSESGTYKKVNTVKKGNTTSLTLPAYKGSKVYYYKIRAYKTISGTKVYGEYSEVCSCAPDAPVMKKAKAKSGKKVTLQWKKTASASGYEVYRATKEKGKYKKIATLSGRKKVSYTDKGLKKGTKYYYKIRAYRTVNGKKLYGSYSGIVSAKAK